MQQNDHDVVEATIVEAPKKPRGFQPGHKRVGGRKAGQPTKRQLFDEVCARHKFSAVDWVVQCVKTGVTPATADRPSQPISQSDRCRMAETLLSFSAPRLSATQVTGANEGPVQVATINVLDLMSDPLTAAAAQRVALSISTAQREGLHGYSPKQIEGGEDQ